MPQVISLREWDSFQHYKDRDPPWIKLYRNVLTGEAWVMGTDLSRLVQVASTLLAVRYKNKIPYNLELIKRVLNLGCDLTALASAFEHLRTYKFVDFTGEIVDLAQDASALLASCPSEKSREEKTRIEKIREEPMSATPTVPSGIKGVFNHWRQIHGHPKSALTSKRVVLIRKALQAYSEADLCMALSGYKNSPHHMGANPAGTVYDSIELMLRDAGHIDAGLSFYNRPPQPGQALRPETAMERIKRANQGASDDEHGNPKITTDLAASGGHIRR